MIPLPRNSFDPVYFGHFKCNVKSIEKDYPNILRWARQVSRAYSFLLLAFLEVSHSGYLLTCLVFVFAFCRFTKCPKVRNLSLLNLLSPSVIRDLRLISLFLSSRSWCHRQHNPYQGSLLHVASPDQSHAGGSHGQRTRPGVPYHQEPVEVKQGGKFNHEVFCKY